MARLGAGLDAACARTAERVAGPCARAGKRHVARRDRHGKQRGRRNHRRHGTYASKDATVAGKTAQPIKEIPNSVSVLTRQQMDDQNVTTIQEALRYVTGVTSVDYGDGSAYFRARGSQLGIEFDGVPILSGLQYLPQFDLAMYDRVEVLRGAAGTIDGIGEPGGVVNLVRKRPQDQFHVSTETQVDTFGSVRQEVDVTGPLNKDGTVRGRAVLVGSDGLESIDKSRTKEVMAYGAIDWTSRRAPRCRSRAAIRSRPSRRSTTAPAAS